MTEIQDPHNAEGYTREELITLTKALLDKILLSGALETDAKSQLKAFFSEISKRFL